MMCWEALLFKWRAFCALGCLIFPVMDTIFFMSGNERIWCLGSVGDRLVSVMSAYSPELRENARFIFIPKPGKGMAPLFFPFGIVCVKQE